MQRAVDWLLALIGRLCELRYAYTDDVDFGAAPHPLEDWITGVWKKWRAFGLPGPTQAPEFHDPADYTPGQVAWLIDYDAKLAMTPGGPAPHPATQEMWKYIVITDPWPRRVGLWVQRVFTYGTACECCHGWRLLVLGVALFLLGWLTGCVGHSGDGHV